MVHDSKVDLSVDARSACLLEHCSPLTHALTADGNSHNFSIDRDCSLLCVCLSALTLTVNRFRLYDMVSCLLLKPISESMNITR